MTFVINQKEAGNSFGNVLAGTRYKYCIHTLGLKPQFQVHLSLCIRVSDRVVNAMIRVAKKFSKIITDMLFFQRFSKCMNSTYSNAHIQITYFEISKETIYLV